MIHGTNAVVAGPLPYDMAECERRRIEYVAEANEKAAAHPEVGIAAGAFTGKCIYSETRPKLEQ